jgi:hypothetical protein
LLHQCARKIATVYHNLKSIDVDEDPTKAASEFDKLQKEYAKALDECPINHDNVDFYQEKASKPRLFKSDYTCKWQTPLRTWFRIKSWFLAYSWLIPHLCAFVTISIVVYKFVITAASPMGMSH